MDGLRQGARRGQRSRYPDEEAKGGDGGQGAAPRQGGLGGGAEDPFGG